MILADFPAVNGTWMILLFQLISDLVFVSIYEDRYIFLMTIFFLSLNMLHLVQSAVDEGFMVGRGSVLGRHPRCEAACWPAQPMLGPRWRDQIVRLRKFLSEIVRVRKFYQRSSVWGNFYQRSSVWGNLIRDRPSEEIFIRARPSSELVRLRKRSFSAPSKPLYIGITTASRMPMEIKIILIVTMMMLMMMMSRGWDITWLKSLPLEM